ncbi:TadE family type IV pilus minor pilin [Knoellia sinensis]|nr:TadE family type IV pilus minor pilin [Knoellia sinensis]
MVTAEIAVALPALVLVLTLGLSGVQAVTDHLRCIDAARVGARLLARGEPVDRVRTEVAAHAPEGARVELTVGAKRVGAEVSADVPTVLAVLGLSTRPHGVGWAVPEVVR